MTISGVICLIGWSLVMFSLFLIVIGMITMTWSGAAGLVSLTLISIGAGSNHALEIKRNRR